MRQQSVGACWLRPGSSRGCGRSERGAPRCWRSSCGSWRRASWRLTRVRSLRILLTQATMGQRMLLGRVLRSSFSGNGRHRAATGLRNAAGQAAPDGALLGCQRPNVPWHVARVLLHACRAHPVRAELREHARTAMREYHGTGAPCPIHHAAPASVGLPCAGIRSLACIWHSCSCCARVVGLGSAPRAARARVAAWSPSAAQIALTVKSHVPDACAPCRQEVAAGAGQ